MRITRIFHQGELQVSAEYPLFSDAANHISRVLRMQPGQTLHLFNGQGGEYVAEITELSKKRVVVVTQQKLDSECESPLSIHLGQGVSRGEKMDFTIQKATELGVTEITPLITERCGVKLNADRWEKKTQHWQKVAISACEQSGRNHIPKLHPPKPLQQWLEEKNQQLCLNLHPRAQYSIKTLPTPEHGVRLLIGPEGGLSQSEIDLATHNQFEGIRLGPRVLRTETGALAAIAALQAQFGDLA